VFRRPSDGALMRRLCSDTVCSSAFNTQLAGAGQGHRPSALRSTDGRLLVAHAEPGTGRVHGTLCNDLFCSQPQRPVFASDPGFGTRVALHLLSDGRPIVFHHDALRGNVRGAACTTLDCTTFQHRPAVKGLPAGQSRVAVRGNGAPVVAYIREREPWIAVCNDSTCSLPTRRALPGINSDVRPGLAVRPDDRPIVYFANAGGTRAYDCADAACSSGAVRVITGDASQTGNVVEVAVRTDGRPVLLHVIANQNNVNLFLCEDQNCSSGTLRVLTSEPTPGAFINGFSLAIDADGNPLALYARSANGVNDLRLARCVDPACTASTVSTVGTPQNFESQALAIRSDGRPVFIDGAYAGRRLSICADAACSTIHRYPLPGQGIVRSLALAAGNRPLFDAGGFGPFGEIHRCRDSVCSQIDSEVAVFDPEPGAIFVGSLALRSDGGAALAFDNRGSHEVLLVMQAPPPGVFADGFE
jgi:hypothetical protein